MKENWAAAEKSFFLEILKTRVEKEARKKRKRIEKDEIDRDHAVDLRDRRIKILSKTYCSKIVTWTTNEETLQENFEKGSATVISRKGGRRVLIGSCVCPYKVALMQLRKIFMFNKSLK